MLKDESGGLNGPKVGTFRTERHSLGSGQF